MESMPPDKKAMGEIVVSEMKPPPPFRIGSVLYRYLSMRIAVDHHKSHCTRSTSPSCPCNRSLAVLKESLYRH